MVHQASLLTVQCVKPFNWLKIQAAFIVKTSVNLSDLSKHLPKMAHLPCLYTLKNTPHDFRIGDCGVEGGNIAV